MSYISVDSDTFIKFDPVTKKSEVLSISQLQSDLSQTMQDIQDLPPPPTDEELLSWARSHFPGMDFEPRRQFLEGRKAQIEIDLQAIQ